MPIISDNPKALYVQLYKELTNKHNPINVYLTGGKELDDKEKAIGDAMRRFIAKFEENKIQLMSEEDPSITTCSNGVAYQDVDYKFAKTALGWDEELCNELEQEVQQIRAALFDSVKGRMADIETYDFVLSMKDSPSYAAKQKIARAMRMEDKAGEMTNHDLDRKIEKEKKTNLEYHHRPVIYNKVTNEETGEVTYVKAERYVTYKEKEDPQYRFFVEKTIQYEKSYDPDAYDSAPILLRDILQNHKEMKEEGDRRREYVKFINDQHQTYAAWKEQIVKEVNQYKEILNTLSPATFERYMNAMKNYNSAEARLSGTREWFKNEIQNYQAKKMVLEEKKMYRDNAKTASDDSERILNEYAARIELERKTAQEEIENFKKKPELDENTIKEDKEAFDDYVRRTADLQAEIGLLEIEYQNDVAQQEKSHQLLLDVRGRVDEYKRLLTNLKENADKENLQAVINYQGMLMTSEMKLGKEMETFDQEMIAVAKVRLDTLSAQKQLIDAFDVIYQKYMNTKKRREECEKDVKDVQQFLKENSKSEAKNLETFHKEMAAIRKRCKNLGLGESETMDSLVDFAAEYAKEKGWSIGKRASFLDKEFMKELMKEIKDCKDDEAKMIPVYEEAESKYLEKTLELNQVGKKLGELTQHAIDSLDEYGKKLDYIRERSGSDQENKEMLDDMTKASDEKHKKGMEEMKEQEDALLKSYQELDKALQDKVKNLNEKKELLDQLMHERSLLGEKLEKADKLKKELEEKEIAFQNLCQQQDQDLKEFEQKKQEAERLYIEMKKEYEDEDALSQDFVNDYEYLERQFNENNITTSRTLEDMSKFTASQREKLSMDAKKQQEYIREKQAARCMDMATELNKLRTSLIEVEKPKGFMKVKNSREFSLFRNEVRKYLDITQRVPNSDAKGKFAVIANPDEVLSHLHWLSSKDEFVKDDKSRIEYMKTVHEAMSNISKAADKYLETKGSPLRDTELGRARFTTASIISTHAKKLMFELEGMMREEQYCMDAANLGLVTQKSGIDAPDYTKTEGFKYAADSIKREGDSLYTDSMAKLQDSLDAERRMFEQANKKNQEPKPQVKQELVPQEVHPN